MKYRTIVVDPPWHYEERSGRFPDPRSSRTRVEIGAKAERLAFPYPTLSVDEIRALPVDAIAESDAHLYLWTTQRYLEDAYSIIRAWGFDASALLVWCKPPKGLGGNRAFICSTEFLLFARRGKLAPLETQMGTWFQASRPGDEHSAKPELFLDIIERVSPAPRLELFARRARFGWDYWGNESLETAALDMGPALPSDNATDLHISNSELPRKGGLSVT